MVITNDQSSLLRFALAIGLLAGVFEELGWTAAIAALTMAHNAGLSRQTLWRHAA
jgi:hypothetical protein